MLRRNNAVFVHLFFFFYSDTAFARFLETGERLHFFLGNRENTTRILSRKSLEMLALFLPRAIFFLASRTYLSGATRMRGEPNFSWRRCFSDKKREILLFFPTTPTAEKKKSQKPILFKTDHLRVTRHRIQCASQTSPRRHTLAPAAVA